VAAAAETPPTDGGVLCNKKTVVSQVGPPPTVTETVDENGVGVFANEAIEKGALVEACPAFIVPEPTHRTDRTARHYVFYNKGERTVMLLLGNGHSYNHARQPNMQYDWQPAKAGGLDAASVVITKEQHPNLNVFFRAVRPILRGEELTISYGEGWSAAEGSDPRIFTDLVFPRHEYDAPKVEPLQNSALSNTPSEL
jgi:hypothetical protein